MNCSVCGKSYQTYDETKACYQSHQTEETTEPPTLDALKNLLHQHSEPIKHIGPKRVALEGEDTPKNWVNHLIGLAKDGNSKLTLSQIRWELQDKSIMLSDVINWFTMYAADVRVEQRPGNTLYITTPQTRRQVKHVIAEVNLLGVK